MKILVARMNHETNTFSPVPTPLEAFGRDGPSYGDDAYRENAGMRTAMSAFIDAAQREQAEIVTPISASANPSGRVAAAAYDAICQSIVDAAEGCDAVMLDLHGAMVAENSPDGEGDLLEELPLLDDVLDRLHLDALLLVDVLERVELLVVLLLHYPHLKKTTAQSDIVPGGAGRRGAANTEKTEEDRRVTTPPP